MAVSLHQLYSFLTDRLMAASFSQSVEPLDQAVRVLTNLRDGWAGVDEQAAVSR